MRKPILIITSMLMAGFMSYAGSEPLALAKTNAPDNSSNQQDWWSDGKQGDCPSLPAADSTKLGIIRQMLGSGKPHAALAYLEAARISTPQSDLLRADGLRQTGREDQATRLYRTLLKSCVAGHAYQGLGLMASRAGKSTEAIALLRSASAALPIDPNIRNDYGYALLLANDTEAALHEFLTAIELAPANRQAAHNLVLLLYRSGQTENLQQVADQFAISATTLARLREQSQQLLPLDVNNAALTTAVESAGAALAENPDAVEAQQ